MFEAVACGWSLRALRTARRWAVFRGPTAFSGSSGAVTIPAWMLLWTESRLASWTWVRSPPRRPSAPGQMPVILPVLARGVEPSGGADRDRRPGVDVSIAAGWWIEPAAQRQQYPDVAESEIVEGCRTRWCSRRAQTRWGEVSHEQ